LTCYGCSFLWSDGFQRSWVKQKLNGVWLLTIKFTDPGGDDLSPFYTRMLAIGKGHEDHTGVIDWYANEIKYLAAGSDFFNRSSNSFKRVKMRLISYLADRPEKCSLLKEIFLGKYGLHSNWASKIDYLHLPNCCRCFLSRLRKKILANCYETEKVEACRLCCHWDMESSSQALTLVPVEVAIHQTIMMIHQRYQGDRSQGINISFR
jgi:hypothetical protein